MNTIEFDTTSMLEIKKSKFITVLKKVDTEEEAKEVLLKVKDNYPNAKHYTYAYIIDGIKKASDDKEPSGTAGVPILNILEVHQLTHVICIVVRYFGGILLGAPGLVRAYSKSASSCLDTTHIIPFISYLEVEFTFPYDLSKKVDYLLKDIKILHKEFSSFVTYTILLPEKSKEVLEELQSFTSSINVKKSKN